MKNTLNFSLFIFILIGNAFAQTDVLFPKILVYTGPSRWKTMKSKNIDTFSKISKEDLEELKTGLNTNKIDLILSHYIDRAESVSLDKHGMSEELKEWFAQNAKIRTAFFESISPIYDNIPEVIKIFNHLRKDNEAKLKKFFHLAIAIAIVWDDPDSITSSRYDCIWGFDKSQFQPHQAYEDIFAYFCNKSVQSTLKFKPDKLRWPLLVHLVDMDISKEELYWARKKFYAQKNKIQNTYSLIQYDYQKLSTKKPNIGDRPYTLQNILKYNGICGDQAHFSSRVAKSIGIPAMKVSGDGRYGGSHAWLGYLAAYKGDPKLLFSGRYRGDMYYTGEVFDPQTRTALLDRHIAMMYDGASSSYTNYIESLLLARIARFYKDDETVLSFELSKEAIDKNVYSKTGWDMVFWHLNQKHVPRKEVLSILNTLFKELKSHPDITITGIETLIKRIDPNDFSLKDKYYKKVLPLYKTRPDLQIRLRNMQCNDLKEFGNPLKTIQIALTTCLANTEESTLILPLVETIVAIAKEKGIEKKVKPYLLKIKSKFPKKRGSNISDAYLKFQEIIAPIMH